MADVAADRVRETSNTTGLAPYDLRGEVYNFRRFDQVMQVGDRCFFAAVARDGLGWETGYGTLLADGRLDRTAIVSSREDGRPINWPAGVRDVFITPSPVRQVGIGDLLAGLGPAGPLTGVELISALQNGRGVGILLSDLVAYVLAALGTITTPGGGTGTGLGALADGAGNRIADSAGNYLLGLAGGALVEDAAQRLADSAGNRLTDSAGNYLTGSAFIEGVTFIADGAGNRLADSAGNYLASGTGVAFIEGADGPVADSDGNNLADSAGNYLAAA